MKNCYFFWFRRDLRLADNAGLYHALRQGQPVITEVRPAESSLVAIGTIRYLTEMEQFHQADQILNGMDESDFDPLADFHPSEVASARLRSLVAEEKPSTTDVEKCLKGLAAGALTLNPKAVERFAKACEEISDRTLNEPIQTQLTAIVQIVNLINNTVDSAISLNTTIIKQVERKLQDRIMALKFVKLVAEEDRVHLIGTRSTTDLLAKLLANKCYLLVEKLFELQGGKTVSVDDLLAAIVKLPNNHDPAGYLPLLKNVVFPNLTVHSDLLHILRAWSCESADGMDENEIGLPSAISLLEVSSTDTYILRDSSANTFLTS